MAAKRKPWWHYLRGPRGHRGLPGPTKEVDAQWKYAIANSLSRLEMRVAELERKLGGSQK